MNYPNEPSSHHVPNNSSNSSEMAPTSTASSAPRKQCPKLLETKRKLLNDNGRCLKCCHFFVDHRAANCPNDFPNPCDRKSVNIVANANASMSYDSAPHLVSYSQHVA